MGKSSRIKGQQGEREFAQAMQDALGIRCVRQLGQERDGGSDVHVHTIAVQVKRAESVRLNDWLAQAENDCPTGMLAALAWRRNRGRWIVAMPIEDWTKLVREAFDWLSEQAGEKPDD